MGETDKSEQSIIILKELWIQKEKQTGKEYYSE